jgi:cell division protein YceG involved in septum cleavage
MIKKSNPFRIFFAFVALVGVALCIVVVFLLQSQIFVFQSVSKEVSSEKNEPFPISVDPETNTIYDNNNLVNNFYSETLAINPQSEKRWFNQVAAVFSGKSWYQNLASPVSRIVVIWPGERKEQVTKHIGDILRWDNKEREEFTRLIDTNEPVLKEGKYFPGQYVTHRHATPDDIYQLISTEFDEEVLDRYTAEIADIIPLDDTLIIASLIEREASDFNNMREVSGVIWNRLFIDMPLQLDATLQYVKGSDVYGVKWWPVPVPRDKFVDSPFNTYQNSGLPPYPIANPSAEAILAALNPVITDCLFYFHRQNGDYHCSVTYEDHVSKLRGFYGQGS